MRLLKVLLLSLVVVLGGCENAKFGVREKGALLGGALGAGLGAVVGNQTGNPGAGVAIGSAFGALAGGALGHTVDGQKRENSDRQAKLDQQERELLENRRLIEELKAAGADVRTTERGVVVNLPDVLFEFGKAELTGSAKRVVADIAGALSSISGRRIAIEGHTDSVGSVQFNERLSKDRAYTVADALVDRGVSKRAIAVRGFGESRPVATNSTGSGREKNRRVEVIVENN
jgi:outer membrane protein OmpA-like peptidoglycan-associated protein